MKINQMKFQVSFPVILWNISGQQALAYQKQRRVTIAHLVTKFRRYRRVESRTPPAKWWRAMIIPFSTL